MVSSGMVRKIDMLGRIVIPKEIRRSLKISSGDDIEMFVDNGSIILKKYHVLENFLTLSKSYCRTIYDVLYIKCFICGKEKIAASSHGDAGEISADLARIISGGENKLLGEGQTITLTAGGENAAHKCQYIAPIKSMGDIYGAIVAYSGSKTFGDEECKFINAAAALLCGQLT